jgi:hypothetical protein
MVSGLPAGAGGWIIPPADLRSVLRLRGHVHARRRGVVRAPLTHELCLEELLLETNLTFSRSGSHIW